jgi:hypothetical protein
MQRQTKHAYGQFLMRRSSAQNPLEFRGPPGMRSLPALVMLAR